MDDRAARIYPPERRGVMSVAWRDQPTKERMISASVIAPVS